MLERAAKKGLMKPKGKAPRAKGERVSSSKVHPPHVRARRERTVSPDVIISDTELDQAVKNVGKPGAAKKHWSVEKLTVEKEDVTGTEKDKKTSKKENKRLFKF